MKESNKFLRALGTGLALALTGVLLLAGCDDKDDEPSGPSVDVPALGDLPGFTTADGTAIAAADIVASAAEADTIIGTEVLNNSGTTVFAGVYSIAKSLLYEADSNAEDEAEDATSYSDDFEVTDSTYKVKATGHVESSYSGSETSASQSSKGNVKVEWTGDYPASSPYVLKGSVVSVAEEQSVSGNASGYSGSQKGAIAYGLTVKIGGKWFRVIVDGTYSVSYNSSDTTDPVPTVSGTAKFYGSGETALKVVTIDKTNYGKFVGDNDN